MLDEQHDGGRHEPLDHADREVDRQHDEGEAAKGEGGYPGGRRLDDHGQGAELKAGDSCKQAADDDPSPGGRRGVAHDVTIDEWVGDEHREEAHVDDVGAEGEQSPVGEEERLDREDGGHHQEGGLRA